jgi:hypothetical protein
LFAPIANEPQGDKSSQSAAKEGKYPRLQLCHPLHSLAGRRHPEDQPDDTHGDNTGANHSRANQQYSKRE